MFVNVNIFVLAFFKFYHIVRGYSSERVVVAGNLAATIKECQQFLLERLEMSGNKEGDHSGGLTEISVGNILLSESDEMIHSSFLCRLGSSPYQLRVNIDPEPPHTVPGGGRHIDAAGTAAQVNQIVGVAHSQTGEDQVYGSLHK